MKLVRLLAWALLFAAALPTTMVRAGAGLEGEVPVVLYAPPMVGPVVDPFRPPAHIGAPGNRGLQFGASEGQGIKAAATGRVAFAGQVGRRKVITVTHTDGVKTTYTGLRDIWVSRGAYVNSRTTMGVAGAAFHFGARLGDHYLDPQILLDASQSTTRARLIPAPDERTN